MQLPLFPIRLGRRRRYRFRRVVVPVPYHPLTLPPGALRMTTQGLTATRYDYA